MPRNPVAALHRRLQQQTPLLRLLQMPRVQVRRQRQRLQWRGSKLVLMLRA